MCGNLITDVPKNFKVTLKIVKSPENYILTIFVNKETLVNLNSSFHENAVE